MTLQSPDPKSNHSVDTPLRRSTFAALLLLVSSASAAAGRDPLLAPYDPMCARMRTAPAPIHPQHKGEQQAYFDQAIPRHVHQIWFGDPTRLDTYNTGLWGQFSNKFDYSYRLWTESDDTEIRSFMPSENYEVFCQCLRLHDYLAASDLLRISLMQHFGGVYVDVDMRPPTAHGELVDLATLTPMKNVVFLSEKDSRGVIDSALFVGNSFIMSAPQHPLLQHLESTVVGNVTALNNGALDHTATQINVHAMYMTGPFFVSRSLAGAFTILPFNYATFYHILEDDDAED